LELSPEERRKIYSKAGKKTLKLKRGLFKLTKKQVRANASAGGKAMWKKAKSKSH